MAAHCHKLNGLFSANSLDFDYLHAYIYNIIIL